MAFRSGFLENFLIGQAGIFGLISAAAPAFYFPRLIKREIGNETEEDFSKEIKQIEEEAKRAKEILNDYTFKVFLPCWRSGTGWILDYEIPEKDKYPTKWYIATNAHVANHFAFVEDTYDQKLPKSATGDHAQYLIDTGGLWKSKLDSRELCDEDGKVHYFDYGLAQKETGEILKSDYGLIAKNYVEPPKLFYAAINFLQENKNKGIEKDHYKDFAVIEVEFTNEERAKLITGKFYEKYGKNSQKTPLDVFKFPLSEKQEDSKQRLYSLGYAYQDDKPFQYLFSYDKDLVMTSELATNINDISNADGLTSATKIDKDFPDQMTEWYGKTLHRLGDFYLLENFPMSGGASGGLVVDANGNIWGLRSMGNKETEKTLVVPLRSKEIGSGNFKTPPYDLILGDIAGQLTSYKQQVQKYILKKGKKTWLSERGKWEYIPNTDRNNRVV